MKHEHYDLICAKAANMNLVVFKKLPFEWIELEYNEMNFIESSKYFLCLPQHKEACLHWLNGGEIEKYCQPSGGVGFNWYNKKFPNKRWGIYHAFMDNNSNIRIKPRKEKRWIIYNLDKDCVEQVFESDASGFHDPSFRHSMHEIEVEVVAKEYGGC